MRLRASSAPPGKAHDDTNDSKRRDADPTRKTSRALKRGDLGGGDALVQLRLLRGE
jgi:hypothetical protein